jgi:predicted naringenin-chalcone synthase
MAFLKAISLALPKHQIGIENMFSFADIAYQNDSVSNRKFRTLINTNTISRKYSALPFFCERRSENDTKLIDFAVCSTADRMDIFNEKAADLLEQALRKLIHEHKVDLSQITDVITVTCTGLQTPGFGIELIQKFGISRAVRRHEINFLGCFAGVTALRQAQLILKANPKAKVLLLDVELCTLHFNALKTNDNLLSTYLFGDGAAACLLDNEPVAGSIELIDFESVLLYQAKGSMGWKIGQTGFEMVLKSDVAQHIEVNMAEFFDAFIIKNEVTKNEINYAIHPGGMKILDAFAKSIDISTDALTVSQEILNNFGNMSSVTIFFILHNLLLNSNTSQKDTFIYAAAFGPGLNIEQALFKKI